MHMPLPPFSLLAAVRRQATSSIILFLGKYNTDARGHPMNWNQPRTIEQNKQPQWFRTQFLTSWTAEMFHCWLVLSIAITIQTVQSSLYTPYYLKNVAGTKCTAYRKPCNMSTACAGTIWNHVLRIVLHRTWWGKNNVTKPRTQSFKPDVVHASLSLVAIDGEEIDHSTF